MDPSKLNTAPLYTPTPDWLRPALEEAVERIRHALEDYHLENPGPLATAAEALHRQRGILTIAQWHGAALVCEELEATLEALRQGAVDDRNEAMEALVQGVTVLGNYLDHLGHGHPDQPMALLPTLNELRAVRRAELLSAGLLMRLDVDSATPPPPHNYVDMPPEALGGLLRRLHTYYQSALLAWYRDAGDDRALGQLKAVLDCLMDSACGEANRRLWWIAGGAAEALGQGTLEAGLPLRRLLGQVERHLHTLVRSPAPELERPPGALLKDLLYYIAQATPATPRVQTLHEAYQLERAVPSPTYLAALSEAITTPEREAYAILAQGLLEDLQLLKARIEHAAHQPLALDHDLDDTVARLRGLADSLALLGLGGQRELLHNAVAALERAPRAALEDLALALIHIEAALSRLAEGEHAVDDRAAESLPPHEYRQVVRATIREARHSLAQARNGLLSHLLSDRPERGLPEVLRHLNQLRGALVLLGHERIARQIQGLQRYISHDLMDGERHRPPLELDVLADALISIEHYLDAVEQGRDQLSPLLNAIARCLAVLGHPVPPGLAPLPEAIPTLDQPVEHTPPPANVVPLPVDEVDDEVAAIFVEEAYEVSQELAELRPHLGPVPPPAPLLAHLRHGFHTLKGSGRIAGAEALGHYAEVLEGLLNRIASGALIWTPSLARLLDRAITLLPTLVDAFDRNRPTPGEARALVDAIEHDRIEAYLGAAETAETAETANVTGALPESPPSAPLETLAHHFARIEGPEDALTALEHLADYGREHAHPHLLDFTLRARALVEEGLPEAPHLLATEVPPRLSPLAAPAAWEALAARLIALTRPSPPPQPTLDGPLEDVDPALATIFLEEAGELMETVDLLLPQWPVDQTPPPDQLQQVQRALHTLKGGARLSGLSDIGDTAHALESVMEALAEGGTPWSAPLQAVVQEALDHLAEALDQVGAGRTPPDGAAIRRRLQDRLRPQSSPSNPPPGPAHPGIPHSSEASDPETQRGGTLRLATETLDEWVNLAKEDGLFTLRAEEHQTLINSHLEELHKTIERVRRQIRGLPSAALPSLTLDEPDPHQALMEAVEDLTSLHATLQRLNLENGRLLQQQQTVQRNLQAGLVEARMIPFSTQLPRLQRLVRQVARELGKEARLELVGASGRLDRATLERLAGPLEHLIRNALAHGIEPVEERLARGKPPTGTIRIGFAREGDDQIITVSDDGRGIDPQRVAQRAREKGLPLPESLTPQALLELLARPGFSTAERLDQVAGRGIGLDAVQNDIRELGGSLELDSRPGQGATFTLRIPFTLGMSRCVLVGTQGSVYAVPAQHVVQVIQLGRDEIERLYRHPEPAVVHEGKPYPFTYLAALLHLPHPRPDLSPHLAPVILVHHQDRRLALHVDQLLGSRELVLKGEGAPLASDHEGVLGATVLGDGRVALVLDVAELMSRPLPEQESWQEGEEDTRTQSPERKKGPLKVLVVDDSITVRKVTERLLTRHHMEVHTARDGLEALKRLEEQTPDIVLLDIEMPRMDGFEVAERIRNSERWRHLPIIMISSRSGQRQRARAIQLGVDRFLSKPYQEAVLVAQIEALAHHRQAALEQEN